MSKNESRMSAGPKARSTPWAMAVLLLGLVGCASTQHSAPPAKSPDTVGTTRKDLANWTPQCKSSQGPIPGQSTLELDDTQLKSPDEIGCVDPGGTVRFASKCTEGPIVYIVSTDGGFFSSLNEGPCPTINGKNRGSVAINSNFYAFTLSAKDDYCDMDIKPGAVTATFWVLSACSLPPGPKDYQNDVLTGKLEVATTGPGEDIPTDR